MFIAASTNQTKEIVNNIRVTANNTHRHARTHTIEQNFSNKINSRKLENDFFFQFSASGVRQINQLELVPKPSSGTTNRRVLEILHETKRLGFNFGR